MKNKNYFILLVLFLSALQIKAQYSFDNVLYGAAYYHEYMPYERLDEDIRLMKRAGPVSYTHLDVYKRQAVSPSSTTFA